MLKPCSRFMLSTCIDRNLTLIQLKCWRMSWNKATRSSIVKTLLEVSTDFESKILVRVPCWLHLCILPFSKL
jgi:hypothetical protein